MKKRQRIVAINHQNLRHTVFNLFDGLTELGLLLSLSQIIDLLKYRAESFRYLDNFIEDSGFLVLYYTSVVSKRCDTKALIFGAPPLNEHVLVRSNQ